MLRVDPSQRRRPLCRARTTGTAEACRRRPRWPGCGLFGTGRARPTSPLPRPNGPARPICRSWDATATYRCPRWDGPRPARWPAGSPVTLPAPGRTWWSAPPTRGPGRPGTRWPDRRRMCRCWSTSGFATARWASSSCTHPPRWRPGRPPKPRVGPCWASGRIARRAARRSPTSPCAYGTSRPSWPGPPPGAASCSSPRRGRHRPALRTGRSRRTRPPRPAAGPQRLRHPLARRRTPPAARALGPDRPPQRSPPSGRHRMSDQLPPDRPRAQGDHALAVSHCRRLATGSWSADRGT